MNCVHLYGVLTRPCDSVYVCSICLALCPLIHSPVHCAIHPFVPLSILLLCCGLACTHVGLSLPVGLVLPVLCAHVYTCTYCTCHCVYLYMYMYIFHIHVHVHVYRYMNNHVLYTEEKKGRTGHRST